jgi:DNA-binding beta-propeller fold protein YncE
LNAGATQDSPGTGTFAWPTGIAVQDNGAIYLADTMHNQIKAVTAAGAVTTFVGRGLAGTTDGAAATAKFNQPAGLAYDAARRILYVCDMGNNRIRRIAADGNVSTVAGSVAGFADAAGTAAKFRDPSGIALDSTGTSTSRTAAITGSARSPRLASCRRSPAAWKGFSTARRRARASTRRSV